MDKNQEIEDQNLSTLDNPENREILESYEKNSSKKEFVVTEQDVKDGIRHEKFDIEEDIPYSGLTNEDIKDKPCVQVNYDLQSDEVVQALKKFQKLTIYKKNIIYTLVLLVIFFGYVIQYMKTPENTMAMFLSVLSLSVICVVWYMPLNHVRKMGKAIEKGEKISFYLELYDNCLIVGQEEKTVIEFSQVKTTFFETDLVFGIGVGKERVFIIPKRCIDEEQHNLVREMLPLNIKR